MNSKGFTLIEIIVSLAIFSVVAVIAIGALVRVTSANRQAQAIQSGVNNVSFVLDSISREMRVGTTPHCETSQDETSWQYSGGGLTSKSCNLTSSGDAVVAFYSSNVDPASPTNNLVYAYLFHTSANGTTTIYKAEQTKYTDIIGGIDNTASGHAGFFPVLSSSVNITNYDIQVSNGSLSNPFPWIFLRLKGYVGLRVEDQSAFDVETTISQRIPEPQ